MKLFSACSGPCFICVCNGSCLAGHGDDGFYPVSIIEMKKIKQDLEKELKNEIDSFRKYEIESRIKEINKRITDI